MEFGHFKQAVNAQFIKMTTECERLFTVAIDRDEIWEKYLGSFPEGTNEIYIVRREHDCSHCKQFIRQAGGIVGINDKYELVSIWDIDLHDDDNAYQCVADALSAYVKSKAIENMFITTEARLGIDKNVQNLDDGHCITWEHLSIDIPAIFRRKNADMIGTELSNNRSDYMVFKRALDEIKDDAVETVIELSNQGALYRGDEWTSMLKQFLDIKHAYADIDDSKKSNYVWAHYMAVGNAMCHIRNSSMGTLLVDISDGEELDTAVRKYEAIVAPQNYKRPKAIFTKRMVDDAKKKIEELGYADSLGRRFATADDIKVSNILFMNRDEAKKHATTDPFETLKAAVGENPKKLSRVSEVTIDKFVSDILPSATRVEMMFEGKHTGNLVSLIAPKNAEAKSLTKWGNGFSWAYSGNVADSMKERVKNAGGRVDGVLRFSIQWNDIKRNINDFDAHCIEPDRHEIFFQNKGRISVCGGMLDVDITHPEYGVPAVENITWASTDRMTEGVYKFFVNNYADRGGEGGFRAEIEFDGQIYKFDYQAHFGTGSNIQVAEVTYSRKTGFTIKTLLDSDKSSIEKWGIKTNQFIPVNMIMTSPNYWEGEEGTGNKHYFFMLNGCKNPDSPNGFYNEFLDNRLMQCKHVLEALGSEMKVEASDNQLSGLGFSSTQHTDVVLKVYGSTERIIKVTF